MRSVSYTWLSARARNSLRHRASIAVTSGITFVAVLIGLVLIPRQASRAARLAAVRVGTRPDTARVIAERARADAELRRADSTLTAARAVIARSAVTLPPRPADTLSPELHAERDSLNALLVALNAAMAHAAESPLPPSFRTLAETPALRDNPKVRVWLDSLNQVDKLRVPFGALGAGDPIYVALTARVNELGRSIRDAAELRRSELRARIAPLVPAPVAPLPAAPPPVDTTRLAELRAAAVRRHAAVSRSLDSMRVVNARIDTATARARELANLGAPPAAMLGAACVIALVIGFAGALTGELVHPRVAHPGEAEHVARARVLAVIHQEEVPERGRRQADVDAPPLVDLVSEGYRTLYLSLAATDAPVPVVTVTGDTASVVATVATNLAAAASYEGRSTLLVDTDVEHNGVASVLRISPDPGVGGILAGRAVLTESIVSTTIGRDRPLDVLPGGTGRAGRPQPELVEQLRGDFTRMERRYDFMVIVAPLNYARLPVNTVIPTPDMIVCVRKGDTGLAELRAAVKELRGGGRYVHGIVLWDDEIPRLYPARSH